MFVFKKLVAPFVLPPGVFVLLLFILAARWSRRKRASAALGTVAIALLLWISAVVPTAVLLTRGLERRYPLPEKIVGDVIILLGGGYFDRARDLTGTGFPAGDMAGRLITALRLQRQLDLPLILSSGQVSRHTLAGARIDQRILMDLGVPANRIHVETASRDTAENAYYSQKICASEGYRHPIIVTSAVHLPRAVRLFRDAGLEVLPVPAYRRTWEDHDYTWLSWLPSATALEATSAALHEYLGLLYDRLVSLSGG
jgi:uncharacterized SAM-binding protein YcdF (DUF218 family)